MYYPVRRLRNVKNSETILIDEISPQLFCDCMEIYKSSEFLHDVDFRLFGFNHFLEYSNIIACIFCKGNRKNKSTKCYRTKSCEKEHQSKTNYRLYDNCYEIARWVLPFERKPTVKQTIRQFIVERN